MTKENIFCPIPVRFIGPITICQSNAIYQVNVPLATYETPLWPSVRRGAFATTQSGGISVVISNDCMTRSILFDAFSAKRAFEIVTYLNHSRHEISALASSTSKYLTAIDFTSRIVGSCVFLRLSGSTGDASGHNMITKAAEEILRWICKKFTDVKYVSVSGNYCVDKKVSSVNAILGRGKSVIADVLIPRKICQRVLKTTPEAITELNIKKNMLGSIINGGVQSANAHFANMLLALYLATGQDAANIIEGSQGITFAEVRGEDLYFSVSLPNLIVGTLGNGKDLPSTRLCLEKLGCTQSDTSGKNSIRLAEIAGATVLCGELSLLSALTKPGELVGTHMNLERKKN